ncbi:hypothetical protein ACWY4P_53810 (plasmid) [Streptomyces sp. LZ34]
MITTRPGAQTPTIDTAVPPLDDELAGLFEDLQGFFGPEIDAALDAFLRIALGKHSADRSQTLLAVLAGDGPNLISLIVRMAARLGDSDQNPALRDLPADRQDTARHLTAQYAHYDHEFAPRGLITEAAGVIDDGH